MSQVYYEMDFRAVKDLQDGKANKRIHKAVALGVRDGLRNIEESHKKGFFLSGNAESSKTHPTKITSRTGNLAKSYITYWRDGQTFGYYGTTLRRAALLEYGGTVTPKKAKALAIPTRAARVGVGGTVGPRYFPKGELFPYKAKSGVGTLARKGSGGKLEVMFILKKSVKIKARPTVKKTEKKMAPKVERMIAIRVEKAVRGTK